MSLARCCSHRKAHRDKARTMFARHLQLVVEGFDTTESKGGEGTIVSVERLAQVDACQRSLPRTPDSFNHFRLFDKRSSGSKYGMSFVRSGLAT
jgi:hypothetical protein